MKIDPKRAVEVLRLVNGSDGSSRGAEELASARLLGALAIEAMEAKYESFERGSVVFVRLPFKADDPKFKQTAALVSEVLEKGDCVALMFSEDTPYEAVLKEDAILSHLGLMRKPA